MSIGEYERQIIASHPRAVAKVKGFASKVKILSLGGCVTNVLCGRFQSVAEHEHIWRVTVPSFVSPPVEGRNVYLADDQNVMTRLNFELSKQAMFRCKVFSPNVLAIDPTSDFINDYFEKDGCIIPDLTASIFSSEDSPWDWPKDFRIDEWRRITPCSFEYIEIYVNALRTFVELSKENRCAVLMLRRKLCLNTISAEGLTAFGNAKLSQTNWWVDLLWSEIEASGVNVSILHMDERLTFTSKDAPWGEWPNHPVEEFYDYASIKMAEFLHLNEKLIVNVLADAYSERARRRASDILLIEELRASIDDLTHERDASIAHIDSLGAACDAASAERDRLGTMAERLAQERDALTARMQAAEAGSAALTHQLSGLTSGQEAIVLERDELTARLQAADAELAALAHRLSDLTTGQESLTQTRDQLSQALQAAEQATRDAAERLSQAAADNASTAQAAAALAAERDALVEALRAAQAAHEAALSAAGGDRDTLAAIIQALEAERAELSRNLTVAAEACKGALAERENYAVALSAVTAERDSIAATLSGVTADRDTLAAAFQALVANSEPPAAPAADPSDGLQALEAERDALVSDRARLMGVIEALSNELDAWKGRKKRLLARVFAR